MVSYSLYILATILAIASAFSPQSSIPRFALPSQANPESSKKNSHTLQKTAIYAASVSEGGMAATSSNDDDDDEEWEYEEYENLNESDFYGSEWKVGTLMDGSKKIAETWCRLVVKEGKFVAVWGDSSDGKWNFDPASQFLSISKDSFGGWLGKRIWAGTVDDFYFVEGTVRGWSPISPASVVGQWQAKRLGVDPEEAGVAPWFERANEPEETEEKKSEESKEE